MGINLGNGGQNLPGMIGSFDSAAALRALGVQPGQNPSDLGAGGLVGSGMTVPRAQQTQGMALMKPVGTGPNLELGGRSPEYARNWLDDVLRGMGVQPGRDPADLGAGGNVGSGVNLPMPQQTQGMALMNFGGGTPDGLGQFGRGQSGAPQFQLAQPGPINPLAAMLAGMGSQYRPGDTTWGFAGDRLMRYTPQTGPQSPGGGGGFQFQPPSGPSPTTFPGGQTPGGGGGAPQVSNRGLSQPTVQGMPPWQGSKPLDYNEQQARKTAYRATLGQGGQMGQEVLRRWQEDHPNDLMGTPSVSTNNFAGSMTGQPGAIAFNPGESSRGYMERIGMKPADIEAALAMSKADPSLNFQQILQRLGTGG